MQKAAAYIRVSTEEQTEYSPDAQLFAIRQYAEKNELLLEEEFVFRDEGISGRRADKRPAFMRMISMAKANAKSGRNVFDVILVHKFDRFARSREDSIIFKSLLRRECGVRVVSVSEPLDDDKTSVILEAMLEAMGEYYSLNLSEEVKKGMTEKARRGELQTPAPFGYRMIDGLLTPHQAESETVRVIFQKYLYEDMNLRAIAQYLNALGIRTIKGNPFIARNIAYIICNPTYIGKMRWTPTGSVVCKFDFDNPETIIKEGRHSAIIEDSIFEEANKKIRQQTKMRNRYERSGEITTHWLQGVLRCGSCYSTLSYGKGYGRKTAAYRCNRYLHGGCEHPQRITVSKAEKVVLEVLCADSKLFKKRDFEKLPSKTEHTDIQQRQLRRQMEKLEEKILRARELALSGIDTPEEYKKNKEELNFQREKLSEKLWKLQIEEAENAPAFNGCMQSIYDILISEAALTEKNRAVKEVVQYILYDKQKDKFDFYYRLEHIDEQ